MTPSALSSALSAGRRWKKSLFVLAILVFVILVFASGLPQTYGAEWIASRALGYPVSIRGMHVYPDFRASEITIGGESPDATYVRFEQVQATYDLKRRRHVTSFSAKKMVLNATAAPGTARTSSNVRIPDFSEARHFLNGYAIPRRMNIDEIEVRISSPDADLEMNGLSFESQLIVLDRRQNFRLQSDAVSGVLVNRRDGIEKRFEKGTVDVSLSAGRTFNSRVRIRLPDIAEVSTSGTWYGGYSSGSISLKIDRCYVNGDAASGLVSAFTPTSVKFKGVEISEAAVTLGQQGANLTLGQPRFTVDAKDLLIGPPEKPYYKGDLHGETETTGEGYSVNARLNRGQQLRMRLDGDLPKGHGVITFESWSRADLEAVLPATALRVLAAVPSLTSVTGTLEAEWTGPKYSVDLAIDPSVAGQSFSRKQIALHIAGSGALKREIGALFDGNASLALPHGSVESKIHAESASQAEIDATLKQADGAALLAFANTAIPNASVGRIDGKVNVAYRTACTYRADLNAGPVTLGSITAPKATRLAVTTSGTIDVASGRIVSDALRIAIADHGEIKFDKLAVTTNPLSVTGKASSTLDLDYLATDLNLAGIAGTAKVGGSLAINSNKLEMPFQIDGDGLGYGRWSAPSGTSMTLRGTASYDLKSGKGTIHNVDVTWGKATHLTSKTMAMASGPFSITGPVSGSLDLRTLADLAFLESAEGTGALDGTIGYANSKTTISMRGDIAARSMVLPNKLAGLGGVTVKSNFEYGDSVSGKGRLHVANAAAYGGRIQDLDGQFVIENGVVKASKLSAKVYSGTATIDAELGLFGTQTENHLIGSAEGIDLDQFTREYKPPVVLLAGIAHGDVRLEWKGSTVTTFEADLASDHDFALNREAVEDMLLSQLTSEVKGLRLFNRHIQKKTIGDAPMRKFDTASLTVGLENLGGVKRLKGPIVLKSSNLDFTIDLGVDLSAIAEGLQLAQEAQLQNIENFSADPIQWAE